MTDNSQLFEVSCEDHLLRGDRLPAASGRSALLLHGAGSSDRSRFKILREALHAREWGTTCFDFVGHGETGGALSDSSLHARTRQARTVIAANELKPPLAVFGTSMGHITHSS